MSYVILLINGEFNLSRRWKYPTFLLFFSAETFSLSQFLLQYASFYCREIDQIKREIAIRKRERVSITLLLDPEVIQPELCTAQRKSHLCIPRKGITRPQSRFPHSCFHIPMIGPPIFLQQNRQIDRGNINRAQKHECTRRNWDWGRAVSFLGIFVSNFLYTVFAVWSSSSLFIGREVSMEEIFFFIPRLSFFIPKKLDQNFGALLFSISYFTVWVFIIKSPQESIHNCLNYFFFFIYSQWTADE